MLLEKVSGLDERIDRVESDVGEIKADVRDMGGKIDRLLGAQSALIQRNLC